MATGSPDRAWARASVHPQVARVEGESDRRHGLNYCRALHVAQLAPVVVAVAASSADRPAEVDVAGRLHQPLALDDPLAVVPVAAPAERTAPGPTRSPP